MIPIVFDHQGTLDKLMGDAIMAFFGAPETMDDHAVKAAETALDMVQRLEALKAEKPVKGIEHLRVGIGINTGQVTVGNLGSQRFVDYTVIGDTVNLGSRLEGLNKNYGTSIIVSQSTAFRLDKRFVLRELDLVRVKGKEDAVGIFELVGFREGLDPEVLQRVAHFESALCKYRDQAWRDAEASFRELLKNCPEDGPVKLYLDRTCAMMECPPSSDWECVTVFKTK
jgi:adenylate cyclase